MDPRKQDFEPCAENSPTFDVKIVEQWSQQFMLTDMERSAEIERLSQHVLNQERMIDELRKNRNELMQDGLQIDGKIDEEKELSEDVVNMARENEDLLKKIENMTCHCRATLKNFHNFAKVAQDLSETKMAKVSEHREKLSELKGLFVAVENKRDKYCGIMSEVHVSSVQNAEENLARIDEAMSETKTVLQKLIDSKQLTGLELSRSLSITHQLQKAVDFTAKKNEKLKKFITAQKVKKRLLDEAIQQFSKEIDGNAKVEEINQLDINQLIAVEKVLMEEGKTVEDDSAERLKLLSQNRGQIEGEKLEITRLELAVANNETCIDGMRSKMGKEHEAFEDRKHELEGSLTEVKERLMVEKLEGLFMKGRLQEVQNQVEQSRDNSQSKLKALESELETYENAYITAVQKCNDEEKILQKGIDCANFFISQLKTDKLSKVKEIEAEKTLLMKILNEIDKLNSEVKTLKDSNHAVEGQFERQVSEFKNLEKEIEALKKNSDNLSVVHVKMGQYAKEFRGVERASGESETVWTQIRDIEENQRIKEKELDKQLQELKADSKQMQNEKANLAAINQKKQIDFEKLNGEVVKLKDCIRQIDEQLIAQHQQALMLSQQRNQVRARPAKVEKKPRGRPAVPKRANAAAKASDWEALIRDCVPVKQEKTELVPFVVPTLPAPKRAKKFFTSRQSTMVVSSTTQLKREKNCDVFDYDSDDDVQFVAQVTRGKPRR